MADLPSGAVTFLFTDIEGSTQLVRLLRDRYADVLTEHQRLLREAFAQHGGHEIDTQGDAFFVAFASAREALVAAIEAQRAISGYPWPDNAAVKVRMGIHTGQAAPVNGRYTGLAVHRAARICAAGHGGQVLVSQATQSMLEDEEEDLAVNLRDLGEQRLKDITRPVRLYQVAAAGIPAEFPPLRREAEPTEVAAPKRRQLSPVLVGAIVLGAVLIAVPVVWLLAGRDGGGGLGEVQPNNVGIIDPESGDIVAEVDVGIRPEPLSVGAGAVWVGNKDDRTLERIDPETRESVRTIPLDERTPTGIAASPNAVWIANGEYPGGSLQRVDPQFNQVSGTTENADAGALTLGGSAVWTVLDSTVARVNPATGKVSGTGIAGSGPNAIAYGEGALWVANAGDSTVYRFNPSTFTEGPVRDPITVGLRPVAIAAGEGAVWVACAGSDNVWRIDPANNSAEQIDVGRNPTAIAVGGGAVWVANGDDGTISKIDPAKREVVDTITTGNYPAGLVFGERFVWVTVQEPLEPLEPVG